MAVMAESSVVCVKEWWGTQLHDLGCHSSSPQMQEQPDPMELISRAVDSLQWGVLVISPEGHVCHYNAAYARLRHIDPTAMVGRPVEELDRRLPIRKLLCSGTLPPSTSVTFERRRNRETFIPIREHGRLLGVVVIVRPASELHEEGRLAARTRHSGNGNGEPSWQARYTFADIVGLSPAIVHVRELALRAAQAGSSVLLMGESGTGKELFAQAIHAASPRRALPFVPVDCAAIPRELLEAEIFGYAPGAFTDASRQGKLGKFELAQAGTIFLDQIGEMPLEMQAKLLRVLQERQLCRVGGTSPIPVACRVIAATNRDLESLVAQGRFRRDLLYRLDVIRIEIPPLRARVEDISLLVAHYWAEKCRELEKEAQLSAEALRVLERYPWPGNVRELVNVLERMLVGVSKSVIEAGDLPAQLQSNVAEVARPTPTLDLATTLAEAERRTLERALRQAKGNRTQAAQLVGLSRASFYRKLSAYGLLAGDHKDGSLRNLW